VKKINTFLILCLCLGLSLAGCSLLGQTNSPTPLTASGTIEADTVNLEPEIGGKITAIHVQEGDSLSEGEFVFQVDDSLQQAQLRQSNAALQAAQASQAAAQANLDLLQAGATETQIQAAQDQLNQAEANRQAIQESVWAMTSQTRPENITAAKARLDIARTDYYSLTVVLNADQIENVNQALNQANSNLSQAQTRDNSLNADKRTPASALDMAANTVSDDQAIVNQLTLAYQAAQDTKRPFYDQIAQAKEAWYMADLNLSKANARQTSLLADPNMTQQAIDAAQSSINEAQTLLDNCKTAYDSLSTGDQADQLNSAWIEMQTATDDLNSLGPNAPGSPTLESMLSQLDAATAQRDISSANLQNLKNGARSQEITAAQAQLDAAKAQVASAQAAVDLTNVQIGKLTVASPVQGVVLDRPFNVGEIAPAGATVVEIGALDTVTLTVYVPEDQYGNVKLGQKATVTADSFPGTSFQGTVTYISNQAEFTPRNVQTVESRSTTVYAVKISLPNPNQQLKPGMPADAVFQPSP
jgi:HlyD family secretion protein